MYSTFFSFQYPAVKNEGYQGDCQWTNTEECEIWVMFEIKP